MIERFFQRGDDESKLFSGGDNTMSQRALRAFLKE
jgi:hypothetical protein